VQPLNLIKEELKSRKVFNALGKLGLAEGGWMLDT